MNHAINAESPANPRVRASRLPPLARFVRPESAPRRGLSPTKWKTFLQVSGGLSSSKQGCRPLKQRRRGSSCIRCNNHCSTLHNVDYRRSPMAGGVPANGAVSCLHYTAFSPGLRKSELPCQHPVHGGDIQEGTAAQRWSSDFVVVTPVIPVPAPSETRNAEAVRTAPRSSIGSCHKHCGLHVGHGSRSYSWVEPSRMYGMP